MARAAFLRAAAVAGLAVLGCTNSGEHRITGISATGAVGGFVFLDANGSRKIDAGDDSLPGARVRLVPGGRQDTGLVVTSGANGFYRFRGVAVGVYALEVDTAGFADTLQVVKVDSASFTVGASDTVLVNVLVGRPSVPVRVARTPAEQGRRVFVEGVALTASSGFADSTAGLADTSGAIRIVRPRGVFAAGDSVRLLGTVGMRDGEPTLDDPTVFALGQGTIPTAATLTTALAATAAGGARDAQLVSVPGATISDTLRTLTSFILTVSDGSGPLAVQLDRTADPAFTTASLPGEFVPGNQFDLAGVLVPTGTGAWRLRPRTAADLTEIPLPVISIRAARALPTGTTAVVTGVALNGSTTFADTTVHLADTSGAIRLTRLRANVSAGDSIRVRATVSSRAGQPTLDAGTATGLGQGFFPTAPTLTTAVAATAESGTRDAQLVLVDSATISDTSRTLTSFVLTVSDGSGALQVALDFTADLAFAQQNLPGSYVPGGEFNIAGVLAPTGTGTWRLKPRSAGDLVQIPPKVITIKAARALPAGTVAYVLGVVLNNSGTFSDSTVNMGDDSAAIRLTRLRSTVSVGDSVVLKATTSTRAGQPTLDAGVATPLGKGLLPTAATLTTAKAASADSGRRDAQLVVIDSAAITDTATVPFGFQLTVTDGSGNLTVFLDGQAGFPFPGIFVPGTSFRMGGLLVPTGTGTWVLRPRSTLDLIKL